MSSKDSTHDNEIASEGYTQPFVIVMKNDFSTDSENGTALQ
jgi:hypothetical protein